MPESFFYIDLECVDSGVIKNLRIEYANTAPSRAQRLLSLYDILFQTVRPYQKNNYYFKTENSLPTVASTGYAVFRTNNSSKYLYQLIHAERFLSEAIKRCTGTSFPAVSSSDIEDITIWVPDLREQEKIGEFLELLDIKIEKQKQLIENLKKYKRGVICKIFDEITRSTSSMIELGNMCHSISSGKTTKVMENGVYPLLGSTGQIGYTDTIEYDEDVILVARVGANAGVVNFHSGPCGVTDNTLVIRVDKYKFQSQYIMYFLKYYDPHRLIFGSGQPLVTGGQLKKIKVPFLDSGRQKYIIELLSLLEKRQTSEQHILDALTSIKTGMLQQLFI